MKRLSELVNLIPQTPESRLLPETGSVSSDNVGNPVIFKAISRIDKTYWLCLPFNENINDRSTYGIQTAVQGTVNIVSNAPTSPGGSAFFDGSSCVHGELPAQIGAGDFTISFWMMAPAISSSSYPQTIFSTRDGNRTDADTFGLLCTEEGSLYVYSDGNVTSRDEAPFLLKPNVWYFVAVVRKEGTLTIYVDGKVYKSANFSNELTRRIFGVGASWTGSSYSEAGTFYMTSLDVLNYAVYDGEFAVPDYQPGILAGTGYKVATDDEVKNMLSTAGIDESRLLPENPANGDIPCFDATATVGGGIDDDTHLVLHFDEESGIPADSSQDEILITANDTAADAATAKFGKARNLNNSYLSLTCPAMATGTGDFTYEGWFYFNELNKRRGLFGVDMGLYVALWEDNTFGVAISTSGSSWNYNHMDSNRSEATATQGVWQHIALVRNKGNVTLYLNGNSILSFDIRADTVITGNMGNNSFRIGYPLGGMSSIADFCDEFRFSTVARWTGNFTPPDAPYSKQVIEGEWGKLNKSLLAMKSDVLPEWHQLSGSSTITLDRANGELQKVTLTQNCTLTAPTLSAANPTLLLQVTSSSAVTVTVGETNIVTDHTGTFQVGWFYDGATIRRYPAVEVA